MFFEAKNGCRYPINCIVKILPEHDNNVSVELADNTLVDVFPYVITRVMKYPASTFTAQPGTFLVKRIQNSDKVWKTIVTGWCVAQDGETYPITAEGINDGLDEHQYVLTPDGMVSQCSEGTQTFDSWFNKQQEA